jgi:diguanylate cyclase (GGDEF)-like protein
MPATPSPERMLSIIELQNAIAAAGMNADEVMGIVADRAATLTSAQSGIVAIQEGEEIAYRAVTRSTIAVGTRIPRTTSIPGRCLTDRTPIRVDDAATDDRVDAETRARLGAASILCVPLLYGESAVGVLEVVSAKTKAFSDEDIETLRLLAQIIAIALHRAYTYPRPRYDVATDALTGLGNRRAFDERIQAELTRNKRYGHSFSLAILDLDGVESAIDRVGQAAGDEALREIARILMKHTRAIDACFRIAADDFAIVMPGTSVTGAKIVADRIRAHIVEARMFDGTLTASFGIVEAGDETAEDLNARALEALNADRAAQRT